MAIQAVIFDVGGVLQTLGEAGYRMAVARGCGLTQIPALYAEMVPLLQRGEYAEEDLWQRLAGRPIPSDAFDQDYLAGFRPVQAMLDLAADLRKAGVRTGVFSNTQASHVRMMRSMTFLEGFDPVLFSCEAGCRKPEPAAFQAMLDALRLSRSAAHEVAFVDDLPENVQAATAFGLVGILHQGDAYATRRALLAL